MRVSMSSGNKKVSRLDTSDDFVVMLKYDASLLPVKRLFCIDLGETVNAL